MAETRTGAQGASRLEPDPAQQEGAKQYTNHYVYLYTSNHVTARAQKYRHHRTWVTASQIPLDFLWLFHHIVKMSGIPIRPVEWVGSSYKDFRAFPDEVQDHVGYALHLAQTGHKHDDAKPLKGFGGAGVLEVVSDHAGDTFRAVYTVKFALAVYVLHAFQKKSKTGIKTSTADMELIERRLKAAEADYKTRTGKGARA